MYQDQGKQVVALLSMPSPNGGAVWPLSGLSVALGDEPHHISLTLQRLKKAGIAQIGRGTARLALKDVRDADAKYRPSPDDMRLASSRAAELRVAGLSLPGDPGFRKMESAILALWPNAEIAPQPRTRREIHAALLPEMPELPGHNVSRALYTMVESGKMFTAGGASRKVYWPKPLEEDLFSMADSARNGGNEDKENGISHQKAGPAKPSVSGFAESVRIGMVDPSSPQDGGTDCRATLVLDEAGRITDVFLHL